MRRLAIALLAVLLIVLAVMPAYAQTEGDSSKLALDMVIVIDDSQSMDYRNSTSKNSGNKDGSDPKGYRFDAAVMLLSLCDADNSRASIIAYESKIFEKATVNRYCDKLYELSLSKSNTRKDMVDLLTNDSARVAGSGQTATGEALTKAVNMLADGNNASGNRKVVFLLTDGEITLGSRDSKETAEDKKKFDSAVNKAAANGIIIYTIGLKVNDEKVDGELLNWAAEQTGGAYKEVNAAKDLPDIFNEMFARLIQSEVVSEITGKTVTDKDGVKTVTINVPNKSIAEMNILVPAGEKADVKLYEPGSSRELILGGSSRMYQTNYFTCIKVVGPQKTGEWKISYIPSAKNNDFKDVLVKVVFSYDVVPAISFDTDKITKTDDLTTIVNFKELNGDLSTDTDMYTHGIKATMNIYGSKSVEPLNEKPIEFNSVNDSFQATFKPADVVDGIKAGDYTVEVYCQGDGMNATASTVMTVVNLDPKTNGLSADDNPFNYTEIHDPVKPDYKNDFIGSIDLNKIFSEPDNEKLSFKAVIADESIVKLESNDLSKGILKLRTVGATGKTKVTVTATDTDGGAVSFDIPVNVKNIKNYIADNYSFVISGKATEKGENYTLTAKLYDGKNLVTAPEVLKLVKPGTQLKYDYTNSSDDVTELKFTLDEKNAQWTAQAKTSIDECAYSVIASAKLSDIDISSDVAGCAFRLQNKMPEVAAFDKAAYSEIVIHDPLDASYNAEYKSTADLNDYVKDPDGQKLSFSIDNNSNPEAVIATVNGSNLTIQSNNLTGSADITIKAVDPDKAEKTFAIPVSIKNVRQHMQEEYILRIDVDHQPEDTNEEYTYIARLYDGENVVNSEEILNLVAIEATRTATLDNGKNEQPVSIVFEREYGSAEFKADASTGKNSATYTISANVTLNGDIAIASTGCDVSTGNKVPVAKVDQKNNPFYSIVIHDPTTAEYLDEAKVSVDLNTLATDEDGQQLVYEIEGQCDPAVCKVVSSKNEIKNGKLEIETVDRSGSTKITVKATDPNGASVTFDIPVNVTSVRQTISEKYTVTVTGNTDRKNAEYKYTVKLNDENGVQVTGGLLDKAIVNLSIMLDYTADSIDDISEALEAEREGAKWIAMYTTGPNECRYTVSGTMIIAGDIVLGIAPSEFTLYNVEPALTGRTANGFRNIVIHDPVKNDYEDEFAGELDLSGYVRDEDGEKLSFSPTTKGDYVVSNLNVTADGILTFTSNNKSGECDIVVEVKDPEGAGVDIVIPVKVKNVAEYIEGNYTLGIVVEDTAKNKNSTYTYTATLYDNGVVVRDSALLDLVDISVNQVYGYLNREIAQSELSFTRNGTNWTASMTTGADACEYTVVGSVAIRDINVTVDTGKCNFALGNKAPEFDRTKASPFTGKVFHDPLSADFADEFVGSVDLLKEGFITDADGQIPEITILDYDKDLISANVNGTVLNIKTNSRSGKTAIKLNASDIDAGSVDFEIAVDVEDRSETIRNNYALVLTPEENIAKNSEYTYSLKLKDKSGSKIANEAELNALIDVDKAYVMFGSEKLYLNDSLDTDSMTVTANTGAKQGTYKAEGTAAINGSIVIPVEDEGFEIVNNVPVVAEEYSSALTGKASINPWLWANANETESSIDLSALFADDATEVLSYYAVQLPADYAKNSKAAGEWLNAYLGTAPAVDSAEENQAEPEGETAAETENAEVKVVDPTAFTALELSEENVLTVQNTEKGKRCFLLWAEDGDGEVCPYLYELTVKDQKADLIMMGIIILAAIIAIIIISIIIYWTVIRKAWTRKHSPAKMSVNGVPKGDVQLPARGKGDVTMARLNVSAAATGGLANDLRRKSGMYKLRAGSNGVIIIITPKKSDVTFTVSVDGAPLQAGAKKNWMPGSTLTINATGVRIDYKR